MTTRSSMDVDVDQAWNREAWQQVRALTAQVRELQAHRAQLEAENALLKRALCMLTTSLADANTLGDY